VKSKTRHILFVLVKLVIAGALLAWVFSQVHWSEYEVQQVTDDGETVTRTMPGVGSSLAGINPLPVLAAFAVSLCAVVLPAARWKLLLKVQDVDVSLWESVRLTYLGMFFNTFVPGTVGGDLFKAYYVAKHTPNKAGVLVGTFVDRAIGMTGLAMLSGVMLAVSAAFGLIAPEQLLRPAVSVAVIACVLGVAAAFLFSRRFRKMFHLQKLYGRLPIAHHIAAAGDAAIAYRRRPGRLLAALGVTLICHVAFVLWILLLGAGLSLDVSWPQYVVYIPLIYVIGAVPITPGGIGLVEKLYLVFFAAANPSGILALALLARMMPLVVSLPGLWVFLSGVRPPKAEAMKAELQAAEDLALQPD